MNIEPGLIAIAVMVLCLAAGLIGHCLGCSDPSAPTSKKCWPLCPPPPDDEEDEEEGGGSKTDTTLESKTHSEGAEIKLLARQRSSSSFRKEELKTSVEKLWQKSSGGADFIERLACWEMILADDNLATLIGKSDTAKGRAMLHAMKKMKALDTNADGQISAAEFKRLCDPSVLKVAASAVGVGQSASELTIFLTNEAKFTLKRAKMMAPHFDDMGISTVANICSEEAFRKVDKLKGELTRVELRKLRDAMEKGMQAAALASMPWNDAGQ